MSNDLPIDDRVVDQDENKKEQISRLSPEGPPVETGAIEKEDLFEDLDSLELPKPPTPNVPDKKVEKQETSVEQQEAESEIKNVVDKRTLQKETTEIDDARQPLTRQADDKEEEFIDNVEEVHSII